jgi:hypothetical protein
MGLIHTRAHRRSGTRAAARLANDQSRVLEHEARQARHKEKGERLTQQQEAVQSRPWYRQPTVGDAICAARQR